MHGGSKLCPDQNTALLKTTTSTRIFIYLYKAFVANEYWVDQADGVLLCQIANAEDF